MTSTQENLALLAKFAQTRSRHYHKVHNCEECGTPFNITPFKRWYCSDQCSYTATQRILNQ